MNCVICKQAQTKPGMATVTLQRSGVVLVFKDVPAQVCPNCGEEYIDENVMSRLSEQAEEALHSGSQFSVCQFQERLAA